MDHRDVLSALLFGIFDSEERVEVDRVVITMLFEVVDEFEGLHGTCGADHEAVVHDTVTVVEMHAEELAAPAEDIARHGRVLMLHKHVAVIERHAQIGAINLGKHHARDTHAVDERVRALLERLVLDAYLEIGRVIAYGTIGAN